MKAFTKPKKKKLNAVRKNASDKVFKVEKEKEINLVQDTVEQEKRENVKTKEYDYDEIININKIFY
jgi:hypothetical protein